MTLERRMQALLDLVEEDRRARCDAIAVEAEGRARTALADAHREARDRMRDAFAEERRHAAERLASARAQLATQRRHAEQRRAAALLEAGLANLPAVLEQRWHDVRTRGAWIDAVVERASAVLPHDAWRVAHPVYWPTAEQQVMAARVAGVTGVAPEFTVDARIAAGLRIAANGIVVDGTLAGLMADRSAVGARLLGLLELRS
jgi:hypothetical protein